MNHEDHNLSDFFPAAQPFEIGKQYWVQCKTYRCLAILLDNSGKWYSVDTGKQLTDFVGAEFH